VASAVEQIEEMLVRSSSAVEPRQLASLLAAVPLAERSSPICLFAHAVLAITGDARAADAAHRRAADALADRPEALVAVFCSWLGVALNLADLELVIELAGRSDALRAVGHAAEADAIRTTIMGAGLFMRSDHRAVEETLAPLAAQDIPPLLRGAIALLRSMSLQGLGMFDASVAVLDADQPWLGSFDLTAELVRVRRAWMNGDHIRARAMAWAVHAEGRRRGRQHDGDYAAALERLMSRIDGEEPELVKPAPSTTAIEALVRIDDALALLPDEAAAAAALRAHPVVRSALPEFNAVIDVLCPEMWEPEGRPGFLDPSGAVAAAALLVRRRRGERFADPRPDEVRALPAAWRSELVTQHAALPSEESAHRPGRPMVRVLGSVCLDDGERQVPIRRERVRAVLTALALYRRLPRERLMDLLWPDMGPVAGANNLRATLSYARRELPPGIELATVGRAIELRGSVDLWEVDRLSSTARRRPGTEADEVWHTAAALVRGRLADDVDGAAWLDASRFSIDAGSVEVLLRAAEAAVPTDPVAARDLANRALQIDEWSDRAWRVIARAWAALGDSGAAHRAEARAAALVNGLV
jgi:DNA-binding SARP family transcriptional activator